MYPSVSKSRNARYRQNQKNKRKAGKKTRENKLGFAAVASFIVILVILVIPILNNVSKIWDKDDQISAMQQDYNSRRIKNDALQQKVEAPVDEEYIMDIARENGYRGSDEVLFYMDSGE